MKLISFFLLLSIGACPAQEIILKTGAAIKVENPRREDSLIFVTVQIGKEKGESSFDLKNIESLNWPKPAELDKAQQSLLEGKATEALNLLAPTLRAFEPFKGITGNWWEAAALLKAKALQSLNRDKEALGLFHKIIREGKDPMASAIANIRTIAMDKKEPEKQLQHLESFARNEDEEIQAEYFFAKGELLSAQENYRDAFLAYLQLPVFYPENKPLITKSLFKSAAAFRKINDLKSAARTLKELTDEYPDSAEAGEAKKILEEDRPLFANVLKEIQAEENENKQRLATKIEEAKRTE